MKRWKSLKISRTDFKNMIQTVDCSFIKFSIYSDPMMIMLTHASRISNWGVYLFKFTINTFLLLGYWDQLILHHLTSWVGVGMQLDSPTGFQSVTFCSSFCGELHFPFKWTSWSLYLQVWMATFVWLYKHMSRNLNRWYWRSKYFPDCEWPKLKWLSYHLGFMRW